MGMATACLASGARGADIPGLPSVDFKGILDLRGAISSETRSMEDRGLGKTRYGADGNGDRRVLGRVGQAALLIEPRFTWDLSGVIVLNATQEQRTVIDVAEAYLQYKPAPTGSWGVSGRAGVFFPPISLENTGLAWTSPYTITPSAINSWVGQELRTIGGEATVSHRSDELEIAGTIAIYGYNDPAGTLLAWRGWSFDDRTTGLFDRLKLPLVRIIRPTGILAEQGPFDRPFHEIDGRVGYYSSLTMDYAGYGKISVMRYDNRADNRIYGDEQWSWNTAFWSFGLSTGLGEGIDLLAQGMTGTTTLITTRIGPIVDVDYRSAYALVSKAWDNQRVSFRADWFDTKDRDVFPDNNNENGYALTLAYILRPKPKQRLTVEFLYVDSHRPERQYQGLPVNAHETQFQVSYRFFL
ncbi:MAG: hypothetical protein EPO08_08150 [Rhodospirillaceae bacterium]|nr:MAG: hypothetical protein EPO08_08150 [Rhodospirillaceae bacterium]